MQIIPPGRRTDSPSPRLAPPKQFLYANKPPSAAGKSDELNQAVEVLCNPHHGHTKAEAERCVNRAARWCVEHRKFDDLEWLSRRALHVDTAFCKVRDEAVLDLSDGELNSEDLIFLNEWLAQRKDNVPLTLHLARNDFDDVPCGQNLAALTSEPAIVLLDVTACELSSDGAKLLCNAIESNSTLTTLHLGWNPSKDLSGAVSDMLERNSTLLHLDLVGCDFKPACFQRIGKALERNASLKQLYLGCSSRSDPGTLDTGIHALLTSLVKREAPMECLGLSYCYPEKNREACLLQVAELLKRPSGRELQGFSLAGWPMNANECSVLNKALLATRTLTYLDLSQSDLRNDERKNLYEGLQQGLCEALRSNPKFATLKLNGWHLGPELIDSLILLLHSKTCRLKTLELKEESRKSKKQHKKLHPAVARNLSLVSFEAKEGASTNKQHRKIAQQVARNMQRQTRLLAPATVAFDSMMRSRRTPTSVPREILQDITHWIDRIGGPLDLQNLIIAAVNRSYNDAPPSSSLFCE